MGDEHIPGSSPMRAFYSIQWKRSYEGPLGQLRKSTAFSLAKPTFTSDRWYRQMPISFSPQRCKDTGDRIYGVCY